MNRQQVISAYMKELAGKRQRGELVCAQCGVSYRSLPWSRYCSNACRQKAKRARAHVARRPSGE